MIQFAIRQLTVMCLSAMAASLPAAAQEGAPAATDTEEGDDEVPELDDEEDPAAGLDRHVIKAKMREYQPFFQGCASFPGLDRPPVVGKLTVEFVISADGTVDSTEVLQSTLDDDEVEACVCKWIRRIRFPASANGSPTKVCLPVLYREPISGEGPP